MPSWRGCGRVNAVDVAEDGVDLRGFPQLAHRYERVSERGDASNVAYEHNSLLTLLVMAYHWEVPDVGCVVNNASCARYLIRAWSDVDQVPHLRVRVPCASTVHYG